MIHIILVVTKICYFTKNFAFGYIFCERHLTKNNVVSLHKTFMSDTSKFASEKNVPKFLWENGLLCLISALLYFYYFKNMDRKDEVVFCYQTWPLLFSIV